MANIKFAAGRIGTDLLHILGDGLESLADGALNGEHIQTLTILRQLNGGSHFNGFADVGNQRRQAAAAAQKIKIIHHQVRIGVIDNIIQLGQHIFNALTGCGHTRCHLGHITLRAGDGLRIYHMNTLGVFGHGACQTSRLISAGKTVGQGYIDNLGGGVSVIIIHHSTNGRLRGRRNFGLRNQIQTILLLCLNIIQPAVLTANQLQGSNGQADSRCLGRGV